MAERSEALRDVTAVLLDLDGTVFVGDRLVPAAAGAITELRTSGLPVRFGTNTTRMSRASLVERIRRLGVGTRSGRGIHGASGGLVLAREEGPPEPSLCVPETTYADLAHFTIDDGLPQTVVIGDLGPRRDFERLNRAIRHIMEGAEFVALQRNRYQQTRHGLVLDAGAFVAAPEYATEREATIVGKPSPAFLRATAESMGVDLPDVAVVGDDITTDVAGAQACGAAAVLVRTGKFREGDLSGGSPKPELVLESLASLLTALGVDLC